MERDEQLCDEVETVIEFTLKGHVYRRCVRPKIVYRSELWHLKGAKMKILQGAKKSI